MSAALKLLPLEAAGEAAAAETVQLVLIEGGAAAAAETAGTVAVAETAVAAGGLTVGATVATAGVALVVIGLVGLGVYLYRRSQASPPAQPVVPPVPQAVQKCPADPGKAPQPKPVPPPRPKPAEENPRIPDETKRKADQIKRDAKQRNFDCEKLWEDIRDKSMRFRTEAGTGTAGVKFRYFDQICSEFDPATPEGAAKWDGHVKAYEDLRNGLTRDIERFEAICEGDLPNDAREWSEVKHPDKSEWQGNSAQCIKYRADRAALRAGP